MTKWVYLFGDRKTEGSAKMKELLGGKGANLAEMSSLGLPVPPGFTITTDVCNYFYTNNSKYPETLENEVKEALSYIENMVHAKFSDPSNPLLVSVRSGARVSMPGMMDTVLNLGLNDQTVLGLAKKTNNPRFAYDSYRRFLQMYGSVVMDISHHQFEDILTFHKNNKKVHLDTDLNADDWQKVIADYKAMILNESKNSFPQSPMEQLWGAIGAVFKSWESPRAEVYRKMNNIPNHWGTAVNVQAMVFGNMGNDCATGVAFTRDPSTGENVFYGEYLVNAQGEDVVAGIRTPQSLNLIGKKANQSTLPCMEESMEDLYKELLEVRTKLEQHYKDMQDIEFTIQANKLWMLQTRSGKRTAAAALKIAADMVKEKLIDEKTAILRVNPLSLDQLLHPCLDPKYPRKVMVRGLPASPGAAHGQIVFTADEAEAKNNKNEAVILVRTETSPEDIHGMYAAKGVLTSRGGMTSHAAVVARGMGKPCVVGAMQMRVDLDKKTIMVGDIILKEGDKITIDGATGDVMIGKIPMIHPELSQDFVQLMSWADKYRRLRIRANAETPLDTNIAKKFGAEGIGLCRTEHMFFNEDRIIAMREMILSDDEHNRRRALEKILPMQRNDFIELFTIMQGLPITIRLLDPPLHEFLPKKNSELEEVAKVSGTGIEKLRARSAALHEANPMLGHRGCRLGITYPEIYEMQIRAIFEAMIEVMKKTKQTIEPEIMIPLVAWDKELEILRQLVINQAVSLEKKHNIKLIYKVGTMIELPRAALCADEIAKHADFFSFGTNDLTQTTFGLSRDDSSNFLPVYEQEKIITKDPFVTLDVHSVGQLMKIACDKGKSIKSNIKLGICGEHGGDPDSIDFCHNLGLDYVSCSPYRVPIARLAAAQAAIKAEIKNDISSNSTIRVIA
ncbi:MAG: pyruvate, phosphate dikinase [Alphaproteobacteria bacterium]|nr:pyruvate, phosphate dikinase [Alphaproteobacteria bacterium]